MTEIIHGMLGEFLLPLNKLSTWVSMVLSGGLFVNKESMSRLVMRKLESYWQVSSAKWHESMTVNPLAVEGVKNFSKNFANL